MADPIIHKQNKRRTGKNRTREQRLDKIKTGPGVFEYLGGEFDTHHTPTQARHGRQVAVLDASGMPLADASGRQIYERAGKLVVDENGRPVMGGVPKEKKVELDTLTVWGVDFPRGEKITVDDEELALKLRCRGSFAEYPLDDAAEEAGDEAPKSKRKRKAVDDAPPENT